MDMEWTLEFQIKWHHGLGVRVFGPPHGYAMKLTLEVTWTLGRDPPLTGGM